jgi:hypothetical protein
MILITLYLHQWHYHHIPIWRSLRRKHHITHPALSALVASYYRCSALCVNNMTFTYPHGALCAGGISTTLPLRCLLRQSLRITSRIQLCWSAPSVLMTLLSHYPSSAIFVSGIIITLFTRRSLRRWHHGYIHELKLPGALHPFQQAMPTGSRRYECTTSPSIQPGPLHSSQCFVLILALCAHPCVRHTFELLSITMLCHFSMLSALHPS